MHSKRLIAILITVGVIIITGGCQTGKQSMIKTDSNMPELSEAALPNYSVGEYFSFDDGTAVVVTAVSKEQVTWRYNNGAISSGYRNFILPALTWTSAHSYSKTTSTAPVDLLWPLVTGNKGQFSSHQVISRNDRIESTELSRNWECSVEGTKRVSVPAGTFDTYVIACKRYSTTNNSWRATRRYYYAPDLGHYVMRDDSFRSRSDRTRKLAAYGFNSTFLPKQEQINLNKKLQITLSKNPDGIASTWESKPGDITAMLVPVNSYSGLNGTECRDYYSVYSIKGRIRKNARSVCRSPEGLWQRID
ncbi:MAG: hypothetical protein JRD84_01995 [Deltaproteobacteria bacterium]|nr:hypothetical protein [Deltaproteobacteria bacterium]